MRTINNFIDNEYKEYAREVVFKRALPYFIDGFKDGGRKIFYYLQSNSNKKIKVSAIAGGIIERCDYHHSETSAQNTIINISKFYEGSNNLPIAIPDGHFGSKISKGSASARYIFSSYNKLMNFIFLDNELTNKDIDSESPEPEFYLPIIPLNIVNGESGIAIGYAVNILPHNPLDVIDIMNNILNNKKYKEIPPFFWGCDYEYKKIDQLSYEISPSVIQFSQSKIVITELKPSFDREKFTEILIQLQEKEYIKSFKDETKEQFRFVIKNNKLTRDNVIEKLQLIEKVRQNINLIQDDTVKSFDSIEEYIEAFTHMRLSYYSKRKVYMKLHYNNLKSLNMALCCLIDNKNVLVKSKNEIIEYFTEKDISKENISICLSKPISSLNENNRKRLVKEIKEYENKIIYYDTINETKLFKIDLKTLRKEIVKFYETYNIR